MSKPTYAAISHHCGSGPTARPAIVFVPTRRHARQAALDLLTYAASDGEPGEKNIFFITIFFVLVFFVRERRRRVVTLFFGFF